MSSGGGTASDLPSMDLFRSEEMDLFQLIIPTESAHDTVAYLGDLGLLQFKDLNPEKSPFQRTYANQVKQCGEMARKIRYLREQILKACLSPVSRVPGRTNLDLDDLETKLIELEGELLEINANSDKLQRTYSELSEFLVVLQKASTFFAAAKRSASTYQREMEESSICRESMDSPLLEQEMQTDPSKQVRLGFVTGLVAKSKVISFERIIFRATSGNMFFKQAATDELVTDPSSGQKVEKVVFVVFFSGERSRMKVMKICEAFGANRYPFPEDIGRHGQMISEVSARLSEMKVTIDAGIRHRETILSTVSYQLEEWNWMVQREKAIYHTLNMLSLDVTKKCLVAEGWCPVFAKGKIHDALQRAAFDSNAQVAAILQVILTKEEPPTFFRTNKFTSAFQEIVDAYGVARYQEANPGVFTIITFPFLFAIMFGDWGHGFTLLFTIMWFIIKEKKYASQKLGDIMEMIFSGRYVILLMSLFSIYTGLIYNEFFSVPFALFGSSSYHCSNSSCSDSYSSGLVKTRSEPYPFGVDPTWHGTRTELTFLNSLKMKLSILIGVAQMNLGIVLSYFNGIFFNNSLNIWYQFIPEIIFLNALFGYLCILIIVKWCTGSKADLYHVMIYMFLSPMDNLGENQLFWGQKFIQIVLLLLAVIAIPWMLLPKPLILRWQHLQRLQGHTYGVLGGSDPDSIDMDNEQDVFHGEFEFSEIFVHQMIHTIEFVLGAVSNTASYLRLWALSLAHAELSAVFYEKVLLLAWSYNNIILIIVGFIIFACATVGVLLVMETLSAFLHALRLHWVEFQNKFYEGDGYKFQPFSFDNLCENSD